MKRFSKLGLSAVVALTMGSAGAVAGGSSGKLEYDQDVTPDIIFGAGNANGGFTRDRDDGVEIGLRGKLRFNASGLPENTFNSNGDGTYSFQNIVGPTRTSPTPEWSFEWSINSDYKGTTGRNLDAFRYELGLDGDPGLRTSFVTFDPIYLGPTGCADHSFGTNATPNGGGAEASCPDPAGYYAMVAANNVVQQSWRYDFFAFIGSLLGFNPTVVGVYDIYLLAKDSYGEVVARSDIRILVGLPDGLPKSYLDCKDGGWSNYGPIFESEDACLDYASPPPKKKRDHGYPQTLTK